MRSLSYRTILLLVGAGLSPVFFHPAAARPDAAAAGKAAKIRRQLDEARADVEAARQRVTNLERALAAAERVEIRETVRRARAGDEAALARVFESLQQPSVVVDSVWAGAVSGPQVDSRALVQHVREAWGSAAPRSRRKFCWLLGRNASREAAAFLRELLTREKDADVLGAALAALQRCPRSPDDLPALKRLVGDDRKIEEAIGYFPHSTVGELASRLVADMEPRGQAAVAGEVVVEPPTFHCLGLEWHIEGDTNHNCTVDVEYREKGTAGWRRGFPFLRCENRAHPMYEVHPGNLLAGSLFDSQPDTEYEIKLTLGDPDGGSAERTLTARTRAVPEVYKGERVLYVAPGEGGGSGTRDDPLRGIEATFAVARPGDVFLLSPGTYRGVAAALKKSGTADRPIVFRGVDRDRVTIDGKGLNHCLEIKRQQHVHLENLTFTGGRIALAAGNTEYLVVRGCWFADFQKIGLYVSGDDGKASRCAYIADNVIRGGAEWPRGRRQSTYGLLISGEGHVICHNEIADHWDGISLSYAKGRGEPVTRSIDIYGNDIRQCVDDGIEADYVHHNVRIFRNRLVNTFSSLSFQPIYGGPGYLLYNAMYNTTNKPFKLHVHPSGIIIAHNTSLTSREAFYGGNFHNALIRNNLILGLAGEQGYWMSTQAGGLRMDHNGYNVAAPSKPLIKLNNVRYDDMAALTEALGVQWHAVPVDGEAFVRAPSPPGQSATVDPATFDLCLRDGSTAVDAGVPLPGLNDNFAGAAPDLGCYERGAPVPRYGPRQPVKPER